MFFIAYVFKGQVHVFAGRMKSVSIFVPCRGSYISAHVLLGLLNELRKRDKIRNLTSIFFFLAMSLIN